MKRDPSLYGRMFPMLAAARVAEAAILESKLVHVTPYPDDLYLVEVRDPENRAWLDEQGGTPA